MKSLSSYYTNTTVGFLVTIPSIAGLIAMIFVSRDSDRRGERRYHMAIPLVVGGLSFVALSATHSAPLSVLLLSFVGAGVYGYFGPFFASASEFLDGYSAATGIALITAVANLGGFVGPFMVGYISRRTGSLSGGLALAGASMLASAALARLLPDTVHSTS